MNVTPREECSSQEELLIKRKKKKRNYAEIVFFLLSSNVFLTFVHLDPPFNAGEEKKEAWETIVIQLLNLKFNL